MYTGPRLWNLCEGLFKLYTTLPPLALALALAVTWVSVCRMPIVDEKAPRECDFDAMLTELKGTDQNTACVFNCQVDISPHLMAVGSAIIYAMLSYALLCSDGQGPHHHGHDRGVPGAGRAGRRRAQPQAHDGGQD